MNKRKLTAVASSPEPPRGTPEHLEWVRARLKLQLRKDFAPGQELLDPESERGFLCADVEGMTMSEGEREEEDRQLESEQRAYARRHLKPM